MEEKSFSKKQERMYDEYRARYLRAREDMISKLPDSLLSQILSHLPTKDTVRTSVLSHRWKNVFLLVPSLDLSSSEFPDYTAFVSFIDKLLDFSREENSVLYKLKLTLQKEEDESDQSCVTRWIDFVANPKLKHLDVECVLVNRKFLEMIPQSLYIECDTLVYLRLHRVSLGELNSVSLPCLKTMRLEHNVYASDASLELLISSCHALEDLSIVRMVPDNVKVLRVRSQTLTRFHVDYLYGEGDGFVDVFEREGSGVFIDAPRLTYLKLEDDLSDSKVITNAVSLEKVNVAFVFGEKDFADVVALPKRNMVRDFFNSISGVSEMKISLYTIEFLDNNNRVYPSYDPLPQFCNVSTLKVTFSVSNLDRMMPTLLESFPNLKSLVLTLDYDPSRKRAVYVRLSSVPPCLLSSLEFVKIKCFNGGHVNMEVARYFLENSQVLKKLVLDFKCSGFEQGFYMLRDLLALPRRSSSCEILLC